MEAAHHRKIELQSPEDFSFLVDNVRRAAAASVAAAFPPVDDDDDDDDGKRAGKGRSKGRKKTGDDLHARVEELVHEYILRTYSLAAPNLTINGMPVDPTPYFSGGLDGDGNDSDDAPDTPETIYEPFDGRQRQRVEDLAREEEDLLRDIAALKRRVPATAVQAHARRFASALAADEAAAAAATAAAAAAAAADGAGTENNKSLNPLNPLDPSTAATFAGAVAGLGRLKQAMPATVARMERARVAGTYALGEK